MHAEVSSIFLGLGILIVVWYPVNSLDRLELETMVTATRSTYCNLGQLTISIAKDQSKPFLPAQYSCIILTCARVLSFPTDAFVHTSEEKKTHQVQPCLSWLHLTTLRAKMLIEKSECRDSFHW